MEIFIMILVIVFYDLSQSNDEWDEIGDNMFNDILENHEVETEEPSVIDQDSLISALKDNIKAKEKLIVNLAKKITKLEKMIESRDNQTNLVI